MAIHTSVFDVIAHEDADGHRNTRHATAAAKARVEDIYGSWIRQDPARLAMVEDEISAIAVNIGNEYGVPFETQAKIANAIWASYRPPMPVKTASVEHEAGLPRMCPFHKDVTNISLNAGDPSAGFSAMAQHWGGPKHCEGDGYEGDKCKFKPQMTTQSWWDERTEKQEQRKKEREQAAELEAQQQTEIEQAEAEFAEPLDQETEFADNVVEVDFTPAEPVQEAGGEAEIPMSMAAKTATETTGLGDAEPKMDKSKWSPKELPDTEGADSKHPTKRKDIVEAIKGDNNSWPPKEIGENTTERQDVTKSVDNIDGAHTKTWTEGPTTAISAVDPSRNPIIDMMEGNYDGFTPQHVIDQAIVSHKRR